MNDERPDALLKSALEKIVYFEARSEQLHNDLEQARQEAERHKQELGSAAQREIELRRQIAELEVKVGRAHAEREEVARANEALRAERASLIGKLVEASRVQESERPSDDGGVDLAGFISELRSEAMSTRMHHVVAAGQVPSKQAQNAAAVFSNGALKAQRAQPQAPVVAVRATVDVGYPEPRHTVNAELVEGQAAPAAVAEVPVHTEPAHPVHPEPVERRPAPAAVVAEPAPQVPANLPAANQFASAIARHAERFKQAGRLAVSDEQIHELSGSTTFAGRTEETLFGFSLRELSAPDAAARCRAAERLKALGSVAAAPSLATALHAEEDPQVLVALLAAFSELAQTEGAAVVAPLLDSPHPDVRLGALKALISLDPSRAGPHLSQAMKDPDRAVRRRASLLALGLTGEAALRLGEEAVHDKDADVRRVAALVLGASSHERSRPLLLECLSDRDTGVRQAAAQSLSRVLGKDVSGVVALDEAQRRREIRRIAQLPVAPPKAMDLKRVAEALAPPAPKPKPVTEPVYATVRAAATAAVRTAAAGSFTSPSPFTSTPTSTTATATATAVASGGREAFCESLLSEVRCAIRGRTTSELSTLCQEPEPEVARWVEHLVNRGQLVRRGQKYFVS